MYKIATHDRAEAARREGEALLDILARVSPVGIFRTDSSGQYIYVNERWCEIAGMAMEQARGDGWIQALHPDERQRVGAAWSSVVRQKVPFQLEYRFQLPNGVTTSVLGQALPEVDSAGLINGYIGTITNITNRKHAEQALCESELRYRNIFENSAVSIWEEDFSAVKAFIDARAPGGRDDLRVYLDRHPDAVLEAIELVRLRDVNQHSLKLFGARTKEQLLASLTTIFVPDTTAVFREEMLALAEGRRYFESETVLKTLQGDRRDILVTIAFPEQHMSLKRVLVSLLDITDRKRAERTRTMAERLKREAADEAAEGERRRLARELHDGVLQDLDAVKLLFEAERKGIPGADSVRIIDRIGELMDEVQMIVANLRTPRLSRESLPAAIEGHAKALTEHRNVVLELALESQISIADWCIWDLYRIAQEAIRNAVQHADASCLKVRLFAEGSGNVLEVQDNGVGFDVQSVSTGLGVVGMRERARALSGEFWITSTPGAGTTVRVYFPGARL